MIAVIEESPRWLRELTRFLPLKNLLFMHGNILDLISYPVRRPGAEEVYWIESDLPGFCERFFLGQGYEVVGFIDPVDGLHFPTPEMAKLFKQAQRPPSDRLQAASAPAASGTGEAIPQGQAPAGGGAKTAGTATPQGAPPGRAPGGGPDLNPALDGIRVALRNQHIPCAFIFNLASRMISSPGNLLREEKNMFTKVLKASLESTEVFRDGRPMKNVLLLICDKLNDLPAFLYLNNPRARSIFIEKPDTRARSRFLRRAHRQFYGMSPDSPAPTEETVSQFAALTEGLTHYELKSLVSLSRQEEIPLTSIQNLCERYKYGITESEWDKINQARLAKAEEFLKGHVAGQDLAIARVLDIIKRARIGLAAGAGPQSHRPRGILFFAGPTGVGKTEMAKSLAELLFGQKESCIRFDMSEYAAPQADQRLMGAPPGYVGYDEGGQLTNAIKEKPFSVLLFDEIEKAHGSIFDKFLQILDDGRLTDGKGETVYFSESIMIFTSNLGTVTRGGAGQDNLALVDPEKHSYLEMQEIVLKSVKDHFNFVLGRPEILNRFGENFVVFDFIRPPVDEVILDMLLQGLTLTAREEKKIDLQVGEPVLEMLKTLVRQNLQHGGRGIRNIVDSALVNPLNRLLFDLGKVEADTRVTLTELIDHGPEASYRFELRHSS